MPFEKVGDFELREYGHTRKHIERTELVKIDRNGTKVLRVTNAPCPKCGGEGFLYYYNHVEGGICFECYGEGTQSDYEVKIYTPEYEKKLNARRAVRAEKKATEQLQKDKEKVERLFPHGKIFIVQGDTYAIKDKIKNAGGKFNHVHKWYFSEPVEGFETKPVSLEDCYEIDSRGVVDIQKPKQIEKALVGEWVGVVGDKFEAPVTFKKCYTYLTALQLTYSYRKPVTKFIYVFWDKDGHELVWDTASCDLCNTETGADLVISGTIKNHSKYAGRRQTELQRVKVS